MTAEKETPQKSWEHRSIIFVLRALGVIFFLLYLNWSTPGAVHWARMQWIRQQPLSDVTRVIDKALADGTPQKITEWVGYRPPEEHAELIRLLTPRAGELGSFVFLNFSRWSQEMAKPDDALFWYDYTLFRLRFDALRCGAPDGPQLMTGFLQLFPNKDLDALVDGHPEKLAHVLRQVLDFDALHPAGNNPTDVCPVVQKISGGEFMLMPKPEWPRILSTLRRVTEAGIRQMEASDKTETPDKAAASPALPARPK